MARGSNFFAKLEGGAELKKSLLRFRREMVDEMKTAIPLEAKELLTGAQQLVPVKSGKLKSTGVVVTEEESRGVRSAVAYEDEKAAAVHEGVHWRKKHTDTKGHKWLERAFTAFLPGVIERIAQRLRRVAGG